MAQQLQRKAVGGAADYQTLSVSLALSDDIGEAPNTSSFLNTTSNNGEVIEPTIKADFQSDAYQAGTTPVEQSTSWGIHWRKPTFIISMLVAGLVLALAHHFYYHYMDNRVTGDAAKQAWPTRIGTGLAFLVTSLLKAGTVASLGQYIWIIVKCQPLTLSTFNSAVVMHTNLLSNTQQAWIGYFHCPPTQLDFSLWSFSEVLNLQYSWGS